MNGVFLDWASTSPIVRFPIDTSKQWCNPNAAYAYEERKVLMDCEERIKVAIGAKDGHVLYFKCATDALEWLHNEGNKCMTTWAHSPYEHDVAMFGIGAKTELIEVDFYCHQLVNQLTGQIHDIKAVCEQLSHYYYGAPFLVCDCTAAIHHISLKAAKVCQYADAIVTSGHKYGCPDIAFMWIDDQLFNWLGGGNDVRNQWGLKHGSISVGHVLALADAVEWACDSKRLNDMGNKYIALFEWLYRKLKNADIDCSVIADNVPCTCAIHAIRLPGFNADALQQYLASKQIYVSIGGSACAEKHDYRVLNAYGLSNDEASEVIRISFGEDSSVEDVEALVEGIKNFKELYLK